MKRLFFLLTIHFSFVVIINAQQVQIKEGAYHTIVDFHKNKPFTNAHFNFKLKKDSVYVLDNIGDLDITSANMHIWAVYQDSAFYINLARLRMGTGFAKVKELGRYSFFNGKIALTAAQRDYMIKNTLDFGTVGFLYADYRRKRKNSSKSYFVLNLQKGMPQNLDERYMSFILRDEKDLLNKYLLEPGKEDQSTMLSYLKKINNRLTIY